MGGASTGGEPAGGSSESAGTAGGGASAGAGGANDGAGGASGGAGGASGGTGGASGGTGGDGACVKNLACKLDPPPSTGDLAQDCVDRINQFLTQCACLPALKRREDGEACANEMAKYDADHNEAHAGIRAKICEPGGSQNSCPGYSSDKQVIGLCMQQMWDEGPPPTADCTGDCYEMYGHFINMTDDSVTQVACGFYTTSSGKVWAVQNFTR
ncbi:MAG TPA: CAP domain-containing protein [Sorangium sp.]|nr:CAP domain-containing protein [Sorangium sp.]